MSPARSFLVIDIETIIDPEIPMSAKLEQQPPSLPPAPYHQVVTIGALWIDASHKPIKLGVVGEGKSEPDVLVDFVKFVEERKPDLVTWNGRGFDLPVIVARCMRHGVPFRHYFQSQDVRYRYSTQGHFDLMDFMSDFGASRAVSLDTMAKLIGLPGKVGVDGKDVGPLVHAGRIAEVNAYCLCDVVQTAGLFLRIELLRGRLDPESYQAAVSALLELMQADSRVAPVFQGIDRNRLMAVTGASPPA